MPNGNETPGVDYVDLEELESYDPDTGELSWGQDDFPTLDEFIYALSGGQHGDDQSALLGMLQDVYGIGTQEWMETYDTESQAQSDLSMLLGMFDQYSYINEQIEADQFISQLKTGTSQSSQALYQLANEIKSSNIRRGFARGGAAIGDMAYDKLVDDYNLNRSIFLREREADIYNLRDAARTGLYDTITTLAEMGINMGMLGDDYDWEGDEQGPENPLEPEDPSEQMWEDPSSVLDEAELEEWESWNEEYGGQFGDANEAWDYWYGDMYEGYS